MYGVEVQYKVIEKIYEEMCNNLTSFPFDVILLVAFMVSSGSFMADRVI